ncbi:MAG TPA: glycoside hydrolase family 13 protein [Terrimesophilobacter sp.]|nr:glycoside hydrolase family 13 protein [Terrimesophilobacter sp.]
MLRSEWWRSAVIYQVYPRSFSDSDGDGLGDLPGITQRVRAIRDLGVDALWLSPFYTSPQKDAGYDVADYRDVDPRFGTLADFDALVAEAHRLNLRLIVDLVPNHTSDQHVWFQQALAAGEGSPERARYLFRDGKGPNGDTPPNNWESVFGGPAWTRVPRPDGTPGQWYLHLFDTSQPDLDWENRWVREQFHDILRFWLDRGVDGFRVDVAHGLIKKKGLPDYVAPKGGASMGGHASTPPYWAQPGVHEIYRDWRKLLDEYPGEQVLVAEAWVNPPSKLAQWVRPDEMDQAFNFEFLETPWDATAIRRVIRDSLVAFGKVGAPSTWVLSNHDVVRHATRLAITTDHVQGEGIGPKSPDKPNRVTGLRRARAATLLMLALPGSAYLYQGEELGLPEDVELPDSARQDPTWFRTHHERYGRDGCRVPIPWEALAPAFGFSSTGKSWLPQPPEWAGYARDAQEGQPDSTLELYKEALALRAKHGLGLGDVEWLSGYPEDVIAFRNGNVIVIANVGTQIVTIPPGVIALSSEPVSANLPGDTTVWLETSEG